MFQRIEIKNLYKYYNIGLNQVEALKNISLSINAAEFTAIAGPSGSGKTTLLNLIGGLDKPSQGSIYYDDTNISSLSDKDISIFRRNHIGFIFQTFNLIPVLTALENVEYALIILGQSKKIAKSRSMEVLNHVGLKDYAHHRPDQLSGGQRQRIAIARALVKNAKFILADEPTANLDSKTAVEILELMRKISQSENITFIFSTHDQKILSMAKKIYNISDGKLELIK